jgi:hypothetical protein
MKNPKKTFIGGLVIGLVVGSLIGGFTVFMIGGTMFVNYSLNQDKVCTAMQELTKTK